MELTFTERDFLKKMFIEQLLHNWDLCDRLSSTSEYDMLTDECLVMKHIADKLSIEFPDYIEARF